MTMGQMVVTVPLIEEVAEHLEEHRWHRVEQLNLPCISPSTGAVELQQGYRLELSMEDAVEFSHVELGTSGHHMRGKPKSAFELEPEIRKVEYVKCASFLMVNRKSELAPLLDSGAEQ